VLGDDDPAQANPEVWTYSLSTGRWRRQALATSIGNVLAATYDAASETLRFLTTDGISSSPHRSPEKVIRPGI
jgi:hypothetical protein